MKMRYFLSILFVLLISSPVFAQEQTKQQQTKTIPSIEGTYEVQGWNPGMPTSDNPNYKGTLVIQKAGQSYQLEWKVGAENYGGTGIYDTTYGILTVGFAHLVKGWFGSVHYKVSEGKLVGMWSVYKSKQLGREIATKKK